MRRLLPGRELIRRRAAGETLRRLAGDYGVAHTTLGRYFARPEVARELRRERRALAARRAAERRLEREVRRRAREQAALRLEHARLQAAAVRPRRPRRSAYEAWLGEHEARLPLRRADLRTGSDDRAVGAVAAGGGIEGVIEATGLRSRENVLRLIDAAVLVRAFENDKAAARADAAERERERLRRLVPDRRLLHRRAAGETLRRLAPDYGVAHTTVGRWFARPEVARRLRQLGDRVPAVGVGERGSSADAPEHRELLRRAAEERAAPMGRSTCPEHGQTPDVRVVAGEGEYRIEASFCCEPARERALQALRSEADSN